MNNFPVNFAGPLEFGPSDYALIFATYILPVLIVVVVVVLIIQSTKKVDPNDKYRLNNPGFTGEIILKNLRKTRAHLLMFFSTSLAIAVFQLPIVSGVAYFSAIIALLGLVFDVPSLIRHERILYKKVWQYALVYISRFAFWPLVLFALLITLAYAEIVQTPQSERGWFYDHDRSAAEGGAIMAFLLLLVNFIIYVALRKKFRNNTLGT